MEVCGCHDPKFTTLINPEMQEKALDPKIEGFLF
jgi:hypothetical protein